MRRRVTFSRNVTLSLSRTCRLAIASTARSQTHQPHLHAPDEVEQMHRRRGAPQRQGAAGADGRGAGSLRGRAASVSPHSGIADFVAYVVWVCERALERGLLPHTNLGALAREDLGAAARGDGVAGPDARVDQPRPGRASGLADQASGAAAGDDPRGGRAADPVHAAGSSSGSASRRRIGSRRSRRWPRCTPSTGICRR